ncbi:MAG TPA: hypothetical protein VGM81_20250 [Burkholderiaceae bacterium]|jgi:hypothetical protein
MFEIFRFYMPSRTSRPSFGSNSAAATVWTLFAFSVGALAGLVVVVATGRLFSASAIVLGAASVAFFLLARGSLPEAQRLYEIDKILQARRVKGDIETYKQNR